MDLGKAHVCSALQGLGDAEQREKLLQDLAVWKERFAAAEWEPVMEKLQKIAQEDKMRSLGGLQRAPVTPAGRALLTSSSSVPDVHPSTQQSQAPPLPRLNTASANLLLARDRAPSTPRARWDVVSSSPVTPLSPTPMGNAFAGGGFWEKLTSQPQTLLPDTPITSVAHEPWSPIVPKDPEGKAAYNEVKHEVDRMALRICASRLSIHSTLRDNGYIHPSMVKSKDQLHGAEITVRSRQVKLKTQLNTEIPEKMQRFASEEAAIFKQYSIKDTSELLDIDTWLRVDEKTLEMTTLLDAQRELLHMNRYRRKSKELKLSHQALQLAWTVKILDDTEHMVEMIGDSSSMSSDEDRGYDYSNFLRSLRHEVRSLSDVTSTIEENESGNLGSLRSSATTAVSSDVMRSRGDSVPSPLRKDSITTSECSLKRSTHATGKHRDLSVSTTLIEQDEGIPAPELSPADREFRHQGPSFTDLTNWAQELKKMQDRKEGLITKRNMISSSQHHIHPALRSPQHSRENSDASLYSWKCKSAAKHETQASEHSGKIRAPSRSDPSQPLEVSATPTMSSPRPVARSESFQRREHLTGPIPLPPTSPLSYKPQAVTSHEQLPSSDLPQHQPSLSPLSESPSPTPTPSQHHRVSRKSSLQNIVRRQRHCRSKSSLSISRDEEHSWTEELTRMESEERFRQLRERVRALKRSRSVSGLRRDEDGCDDAMGDEEEASGIEQ
ncbi:Nn.00g069610.m01.CDS01 [Neocucurbitaria sp. VM-36]